MADNPDPIWVTAKAALAVIAGSTIAATILWGGAGGATNALVIRTTWREAVRLTLIGALVAAGLGGLAAPIVSHWLGLPAGTISGTGSAAGFSAAYLTGLFGGAGVEAALKRIRGAGGSGNA